MPADKMLGAETAEYWFGPLDLAKRKLKDADYFLRIEAKYGLQGLVAKPKTFLTTIHGAKGREWDEVKLVRSWGYLPAQAIQDSVDGRLSETCVAYVAVSRHRVSLELLDADSGIPYAFPT